VASATPASAASDILDTVMGSSDWTGAGAAGLPARPIGKYAARVAPGNDGDDAIARARAALADGGPPAAFAALRPALEFPGTVDDPARWSEALLLFARIAAGLGHGELAAQSERAAAAPDDAEALFTLGYGLVEAALEGVAATVLTRADRLAPGTAEIVGELAAALEGCGRHAEACGVLRHNRALVEEEAVLTYLLAFNATMAGDLDEARRVLPVLRRLAGPEEAWAPPRIERYLARADAVRGTAPLDGDDLRGWHFVLTGGLLLHSSPHGRDQGMRGRYALLQDQEELCREGIARVEAALGALGLSPPRVLLLGDRDSAILGRAAAAALGLPAAPWSPDEPGLIVAYNLAAAAEAESLRAHRPGQVLWAHAVCWTELQPLAADLVTLVHQFNRSPWGARLGFDPETRTQREIPPVMGTPEELGARVAALSVPPEALADVPALTRLAAVARPLAAALQDTGERDRQFPGSPVKSSRFR
jgi:hypothetical protein